MANNLIQQIIEIISPKGLCYIMVEARTHLRKR